MSAWRAYVGGAALAVILSTTIPAAGSSPAGIQAMIDTAAPGSTVIVPPGVHAGVVTIDRPLRLLGEPGAVLNGQGIGSVITIAAPDVEISGFTLTGSGRNQSGAPSGLLVTKAGDRAWVHDLSVEHSYIGITIQRARGVTIERVRIVGEGIITGELHATEIEGKGVGDGAGTLLRGDGIWLYDAIAPVVRDSEIRTVRDGVLITYGTDPVIDGSLIADSRYAVHDMYAQNLTITDNRMVGNLSGTVLMYGGPVTVEGNTITDSGSASTGFGVLVKDAGGVTVSHNVIADNRVGILVDDAGRTEGDPTLVDSTTFAMNQVGALLVPSADASFTGNGFIENTTQVALHGQGEVQAVWGSNGTGNYWSDYGGFDAAGDGVGDLAYVRSGRTSELIARQPILLALASGPAFRLLAAVEDRWAPVRPVVNDEHPLTSMTSPPVSGLAHGGSPPLAVIGVAMLALAGGALGRTRRRGGGVHA